MAEPTAEDQVRGRKPWANQHLGTAGRAGGSAWAPLRRRIFLMLFVAQLASNVGTWMQNVWP